MKTITVHFIMLLLAVTALCQAASAVPQTAAQPTWPDTDAGQMASAWVQAVNANDLATYKDFVSSHFSTKRLRGRSPEEIAKQHTDIHRQVTPLKLVEVTKSEKSAISVTLQTKTGEMLDLTLGTDPADPKKIDVLDMARRNAGKPAAAEPAGLPDTPLRSESVRQMCETAAHAIESAYVDRAKAPSYAAALRTACEEHEFDNLTTRTFLREFTDKLREITGDRHMYVRYDNAQANLPARDKSAVAEAMNSMRAQYGHGAQPYSPAPPTPADAQWGEHGFQEVKMLDGNIGYVSISVLPSIEEAAGAASTAMRELAGAKALIFDLRDMRGGSQEMVNLLCSYVFAEPHKLLLTTVFPAVNARDDQYTFAKLNGTRLPNVPVYILTNGRTFSAGEAFAYILQQFKRATVVGEKTAGGGHLNDFVALGEGFLVSIAVGRPIHPVSKTGWEGVGVVPDVPVAANEALDRARALALEKIASSAPRRTVAN